MAEQLKRSRRYGFVLSAIFRDIDDFKRVNDTHGHPAGDLVLTGVAGIISSGLRDTDVAARYGGEEYIVLTPHTALPGATEVAQRVIDAIREHAFTLPGAIGPVRVACSAGVATLARNNADAKSLLDAADRHMYQAKEQGRNRVVSG